MANQSGRDEHRAAGPDVVRVAVLTISDTRTADNDSSGDFLAKAISVAGHELMARKIVKDEAEEIRAALQAFMTAGAQIILTSGGTGIAGRDVTIPVVESFIKKPMPGFGELFRMLSFEEVKGAAMLSRAVGGLAENALIFALPGSRNAVKTAWEKLLKDELSRLVFELVRHKQPQ